MKRFLEALSRRCIQAANLDFASVQQRLRPLQARHAEISAVMSLDDDPGQPNARLLDVAEAAIREARVARLTALESRPRVPHWISTWPGEHYRFLNALVAVLQPRCVLEIGTHSGLSALAMLASLPANAHLATFDIVPWNTIASTFLTQSDFSPDRFSQVTADLGSLEQARRHEALLQQADLVFLDAAKDGALENKILDNFEAVGLKDGTLIVLDDIRLWNMLGIWRGIRRPKLDMTSFGHWSGTGLVEWSNT